MGTACRAGLRTRGMAKDQRIGFSRYGVVGWAVQVVRMVVLGRKQYLFRRARGELFRLHISSWKGVCRTQGGDVVSQHGRGLASFG